MRFIKTFLVALLLFAAVTFPVLAAETHASAATHNEAAAEHSAEHHGLPPSAPVFNLGPIQFTSSMVVTWSVALLLILVAQMATRNIQLVPSGLQNFVEWLVEGMYGFFEEVLGADLVKKSFWFFCTLFVFILFTNWFGLIPGVGTVGYGSMDAAGHFHLAKPLLRGGNADLNMTLAMSLTFFFLWVVWSLQSLGIGGALKHIFSGGDNGNGVMALFMAAIFLFVGVIEVISITFRPVSLSFRLYGNIFAGENILEAMMTLVPWLGWILPLPFYFLELLVGLVQALVFALLTSVFTALMCAHHDEGHGHDKEHKHGAHAP
ncbi:MAG: F0F1 ATP synthase subunit A [Verrucomicrobia bacterium]|nr:F0F1 ATP synthase subunit A [Verrucomicrobiota bacterium]